MSSRPALEPLRLERNGTERVQQPLLVLSTGAPIAEATHKRGNFFRLIQEAARDAWAGSWLDLDATGSGALPAPEEVSGVIVSGSPARVTDREPWILRTIDYLGDLDAAGVPVLGICFGHQLLGEAHGGQVAANPRGREIGTVPLEVLEADPVLGLERAESDVRVNTSHQDSVVRLPAGARVLARTQLEPYAAVRFSPSSWGVQFHPEIDAEVMRYYIQGRREDILREGIDADLLHRAASDTPWGARVIPNFIRAAVIGRIPFRAETL